MYRKSHSCVRHLNGLFVIASLFAAGCDDDGTKGPIAEGGVDSANAGMDADLQDLAVRSTLVDAADLESIVEAGDAPAVDAARAPSPVDGSPDTGKTALENCGNGVCGVGESSSNCCSDCGCGTGSVCSQNLCITPVAITAGGYHSCLLLQDGTVLCWGSNDSGELGNGSTYDLGVAKLTPVSGLTNATAIAAGGAFTCALLTDQTVKCWGDNGAGQLGNGTKASAVLPVPVSNLLGVTAIAAGQDYACAVLAGGTVKCWGNNSAGQLGDGTTTQSSIPVLVKTVSGASAVAAGLTSTCARLSDGTVKCWGDNTLGQLGNGTGAITAGPVQVSGLESVTSLAALRYLPEEYTSFCAALVDGSVKCWGGNSHQEVGATRGRAHPSPIAMAGLAGAQTVAGGEAFACAVTNLGTVACWGYAGEGQLGNGTNTGNSAVPRQVSGLSTAVAAAAGAYHACALLSNGSVECWGSNTYKQLGTTSVRGSAVPILVLGQESAPQPAAYDGGIDAPDKEVGSARDAGFERGPDAVTVDALPPGCPTPGATACKTPYTLRTCKDGAWVDTACDGVQLCYPGAVAACRPACPDLAASPDALVVCYAPYDPAASYTLSGGNFNGAPRTAAYVQSDLSALPDGNVYGAAYDRLDLPDFDTYASVATVAPIGPVWHAPAATRWAGRIYIWGYLGLKEFAAKYGARPSKVTLHVKARKIADSGAHAPVPLFSLWNGSTFITSYEDASASLNPSNDWSVLHRDFSTDEIAVMSLGVVDDGPNWEVDFASGTPSTPAPTEVPENVEIAWYAVTLSPAP